MTLLSFRGMALLMLAGWLVMHSAAAAEFKPFLPGSASQIRQAHAGQSYVLALWSLGCPPCYEELAMLAALQRERPALRLVLISTDTPDDLPALRATLQRYALHRAEHWVFADAFTERLRFEIDRDWQGELPRSYLVERDGTIQTVSGRLERTVLVRWLDRQASH